MRFVKTAENLFGLPQGFTRVEYLESSGTQYIDTGYKPIPATTKFEFMFQPDNIAGNSFLFGCRPDTSIGGFTCTTYFATGSVRQDWAGLNTYFSQTNVNTKYLYTAYDNSISLNTNSVTGTTARSTTRLNLNFLLCAVNTNGTADDRRFIGKIYFSRLWDDGVLVRDFIPCVDPLGVPCMFDLVEKKPYYNAGTGSFTAGRQVIPVEYLESTGTQYIDTGVTGFADFEIGLKLRTNVANVAVFCSNNYRMERYNTNNPYWRFRNNIDSYNSEIRITEYHVMAWKNNQIYADGVKIQDLNKTWNVDANTTLFGMSTSRFPNIIYFCKLWNPADGTLVRDYIPCKDENNVGFMFDALSGTVYENEGTGAFIVGQNKYKMKLRLIKDNILPTGYTQVEYIEAENGGGSTVVQYAVGNYRLTDTTDWEITFSAESPGNNWVLGQPTWIGVHYRKDTTTGNLPRVGITNSSASVNQCYVDYTNNEKITLALKGADVYANGVKVGSITRVSAPAAQTKYGIFAYKDINQALPSLRIPSARIYRLKIWDNGVLVQDLIPAMKDGVAGFYERVNKTFIEKESNSTSDFTTGKPVLPIVRFIKDIVPREYAIVNYIESTGTQYIDTGIAPSNITPIAKMKFAPTQQYSSGSYGIFGCFGANNTRFQVFYNSIGIGTYVSKSWQANTTYELELNGKVPSATINGSVETSGYSNANGFSSDNMYLFTRNNGNVADSGVPLKLYYCKIWDNNTLIRNFIPVVRRIDKVAGMWDTVTKQFFTTPVGAFNYG